MKDYEGKLMGNFCELSRKSFFLLFDVEKGMLKYLFFVIDLLWKLWIKNAVLFFILQNNRLIVVFSREIKIFRNKKYIINVHRKEKISRYLNIFENRGIFRKIDSVKETRNSIVTRTI